MSVVQSGPGFELRAFLTSFDTGWFLTTVCIWCRSAHLTYRILSLLDKLVKSRQDQIVLSFFRELTLQVSITAESESYLTAQEWNFIVTSAGWNEST